MRTTLALLILLFASDSIAQVTLDQTYHDFGEIYKGDKRVAEFNLMNNSDKKLYILRADKDMELDIRFSTKTVEPGAYATIRIQVNPGSKGRFNKRTSLWISSSQEPFPLELVGDVKELETSFQPCPTFRYPNSVQAIQFSMVATVIDANTELPVGGATIQMLRNGVPMETPLIADEGGKASLEIPLGLYYVITSAGGYETDEADIYLNRSRREVKIKLKPLEKRDDPIPEPVKTIELSALESTTITAEPEAVTTPARTTMPEGFSPENYSANNIVFLIDVSGSMRQLGRLDLLKASMLELVKILRDIDKVSILTYTATSKMVMESMNATESNKKLMVSIITGLEAKGSTQGGQALQSAFAVVKRHYVKNGSNQVVMATDGLFRDKYSDMLKLVEANTSSDRNISVVGIKNASRSAAQMLEIATAGSGHYINIQTYDDAQQNLVHGIKAACVKN
ncbi:MAG TPA: VWA domain-containing protein [Flavobacteriales bacterium]|nr:VWA domain-containing protein [Flavobacteriales bacterium]